MIRINMDTTLYRYQGLEFGGYENESRRLDMSLKDMHSVGVPGISKRTFQSQSPKKKKSSGKAIPKQ